MSLPTLPSDSAFAYQDMYDKQLQAMLLSIQGVNSVSVMVTLDASESIQVADNSRVTKTSQSGTGNQTSSSTSTDNQVVTTRDTNGDEVPYVIQRLTPKVRGVLVTVYATDFAVAREEIIDAITNVLDVPAYKISVEPEKSKS